MEEYDQSLLKHACLFCIIFVLTCYYFVYLIIVVWGFSPIQHMFWLYLGGWSTHMTFKSAVGLMTSRLNVGDQVSRIINASGLSIRCSDYSTNEGGHFCFYLYYIISIDPGSPEQPINTAAIVLGTLFAVALVGNIIMGTILILRKCRRR